MNNSALEIRHLKTLLALAETGSVSQAARRVFLTQSALSQQLKQLEEHYGLALFERKSQPLRFTLAGERLLTLARELIGKVAAAERDSCSRSHRFPPTAPMVAPSATSSSKCAMGPVRSRPRRHRTSRSASRAAAARPR